MMSWGSLFSSLQELSSEPAIIKIGEVQMMLWWEIEQLLELVITLLQTSLCKCTCNVFCAFSSPPGFTCHEKVNVHVHVFLLVVSP